MKFNLFKAALAPCWERSELRAFIPDIARTRRVKIFMPHSG